MTLIKKLIPSEHFLQMNKINSFNVDNINKHNIEPHFHTFQKNEQNRTSILKPFGGLLDGKKSCFSIIFLLLSHNAYNAFLCLIIFIKKGIHKALHTKKTSPNMTL